MMRMVPDQRVNRTRANGAYARFARWLTIPPSLLLRAGTRLSSRRGGAGRRPRDPKRCAKRPELRLSRRLERSRGRRTWRWRYAPSDLTSLAPLGF
jgi:hypothetical protein